MRSKRLYINLTTTFCTPPRYDDAEGRKALEAYALAVERGAPVPDEEHFIAKDLTCSMMYSVCVLRARFPAGEDVIAKNEVAAKDYLARFPEAKIEWAVKGWTDWLDT